MGDDQTNIRRWIASFEQTRRMFGHHRDTSEPKEPQTKLREVSDEELEELEEGIDEE